MTAFTARDLDRRSAAVLAACDDEGRVEITHRDGRRYTLKREETAPPKFEVPDFEARDREMQKLGMEPLSANETEALFQMMSEDRDI